MMLLITMEVFNVNISLAFNARLLLLSNFNAWHHIGIAQGKGSGYGTSNQWFESSIRPPRSMYLFVVKKRLKQILIGWKFPVFK